MKPNLSKIAPLPDWSRRFDDPIPIQGGKPLFTLRDAASYITKLPKAEHDAPAWRAAVQALLLVAEHGGDTMLPRIGMMRALYPGKETPLAVLHLDPVL
jgi:hypothetical protein